jgi:hypothetical protein
MVWQLPRGLQQFVEVTDEDAPDGTGELCGRDDGTRGGGVPAKARDQPDKAEGGQGELRHHEQCGKQVDAEQERAAPVGITWQVCSAASGP